MNNPTLITDTGLNQYGVGCTLITQLSLMIKKEIVIVPQDVMTIQVGLEIYNEITKQWEIIYTPLGTFYVDNVEEKGAIKSIKAYDQMYKLRKGYFPSAKHSTTYGIANDIARITGLNLKGISFNTNNVNISNEQLEGKTQIEMLSLIAGAIGGHVRISRDGSSIEFIEPINHGEVYTESDYATPTLDDATSYHITKLRINYSDKITNDEGSVIDEGYYEVGTGNDANTLELSNPLLKGQQAQATNVLNKIKQLNGYKRFDTTLRLGDYRLESMDVVTYTKGEVEYIVPILYMKMKLTYRGLSIETQSPTVAETKREFSFKGTLTQKVENIYADLIQVKQLTANKVTTDELEATVATIEKLYVKHGQFDSLVGNSIAVQEINVNIANINVLVAGKADISELNAAVANINILNADLGVIKNLVNGNLSSENIQAGGITSDKLTIANGFIKDAMIDSLNANKITAGQINTALVQVASSSGNLVINDNTIQIRDANRVRVQIGKDASNDYSMSVWDPSGKLMFDARGLKADAIKEGIIRNDMISAHANIDGSKLNISSVVSEINEGSTNLKASKVQINGVAQTLEVAFNLLKTQADGTKSQTESNTTAINVAQGKINTLIQDTTITKDGQTVKLKDEYSKLEQTVGSLSSTIGKQQTIIDDHTGKITAFNSEMVSLKQNLNGLSLSVSTAETTIQSHTQQLAQKADLKTVDEKIDGIQVGGRNLIIRYNELPKRMVNKDGAVEYREHSSLMNDFISVSPNECLTFSQLKDGGVYDDFFRYAFYAKDKVTVIKMSYNMDDVFQEIVPEGAVWLRVSYKTGNVVKLERGNKVTDWTPAPEDVQASIDTKANSVDVYVKSETYTKTETESAIKVAKDEINLGVSSTYETKTNVETQINGVKSSVTNLESRISKAEQKITDSAIIQTVSQTINQAKTEAIQSANSNTANQLKNYSTTLQMNSAIQQKADSITSDVFKIETSLAVDNLLSNGNFTNELNNWQYRDHGSSVNYTLTANTDWTMTGKTALLITQSNHPQGYDSGFTQEIDVKPNTDYTFTGYIASHRAEGMAVVKDDAGNWLVFDKTDADYDQYTGGPEVSRWKKIRLVYWSGNRTKLQLHLAMGKSNNNGHVWFHDFMVTEGNTDLCWKPSQKETRTQITQLDNRISSTVTSVETIDGKVNKAQSQIDQHAHQIATKVNANDFSSLIQQNGHSIMWAINSSRGSNGIGLDSSGLYGYNNNITTLRLTEGKFHAYNSWNGNHMGYFGTNGDDLRACLYDTNTFSVYSNDTALLFRARYERDANYGNATLDMCGGINFIHKPGQDVGINQLLLGNDDRSDRYGFHNMSIRCWNSIGFQDNYGYTNMFADVRRGRWIMKGALYQNTQTPPATFSMNFDGEDEIYSSGYERSQAIDSVMNLKTGVYVDNDGECCSAIYGGYSELITTEYQDEYGKITTHLNHEALNASLVVTCQEQQKLIKALQKELNEIKEYLNVA